MAYILVIIFLVMATLLWVGMWVVGMMAAMPFGLLGLLPLACFFAIFIKLLMEKNRNQEDNYYDKKIKR